MFKANSIIWLSIALTVFALATAVGVSADEFKVCARCHEQDGNSTDADNPIIAGFTAGYIVASMEEYRAGRRDCGTSKLKCRMAAKWSDEEIAAAAAYYAQFERAAPEQSFDSALAATGQVIHDEKCASCHSSKELTATDSQPAGMLNGQWREYLEYALEQYASGGRQQPEDMRLALEALDEAQKDGLLHYYASGP